jgi:hypothetical protein
MEIVTPEGATARAVAMTALFVDPERTLPETDRIWVVLRIPHSQPATHPEYSEPGPQ